MKYYLFIDESGDHGLTIIDPDFPVFLLCGILVSENEYENIRESINYLKTSIWGDKKVILHSRDIRKCQKEFEVLFDLDLKRKFYEHINLIMTNSKYTVISFAIRKDNYIKKIGRLSRDVYELSLSIIIERAIFFLDDLNIPNKKIEIIIEKRGRAEDKKLDEHFQRLLAKGTGFVEPKRLFDYQMSIVFKNKNENINGLQLADLVAYPIARYVLDPERANPAFEILEPKIYTKNGNRYGLKIYP